MAGISFVWILSPLEVDLVWKDGVGVEVKVDGVVFMSLEEAYMKLRDEVRVLRQDSYRYYRLSCILLGERRTPCSTESRGVAQLILEVSSSTGFCEPVRG